MQIDRHSPTAHAAYHDLMRLLRDEAVSEIRGTPTRVTRAGRAYWYDSYRVGSEVKKRYIGEASSQLDQRIATLQELKAATTTRASARSRLVRLLRAEGFLTIDAATGSLMAALAGAGVFRLGGTIVGTHAFRLYEGELGIRYGFNEMAQTGDIDIASFERLSLVLDDQVTPALHEVLKDFAFDALPTLGGEPSWRWRQTRGEALVEFLTPSFEAEEGVRPLAALGVAAQALHHLNYLIAEPITAAVPYRSGVLVQIPRPERFAVHKLVVADRRRGGRDAIKAEKDRRQAAFLIGVLAEDRPDELREAYDVALAKGPKWRERIARSLDRLPETRALLSNA